MRLRMAGDADRPGESEAAIKPQRPKRKNSVAMDGLCDGGWVWDIRLDVLATTSAVLVTTSSDRRYHFVDSLTVNSVVSDCFFSSIRIDASFAMPLIPGEMTYL